VPNAAIAAQIHQSLDVHGRFSSQVTFYDEIRYSRTQIRDFWFSQVFDLGFRSNSSCTTNLLRAGISDAENRRQCNHDVLVDRYIYA
jgi:hypothetical protein